jgi:MoaA/NifB/PqqE/SkfB family radical SAM enzyme
MIANFAITYRCNSRCSTCGIWKTDDPSFRELTLEKIRSFFESENDFLSGVKSVQLTGGEPFLRHDIVSIAESIWRSIPDVFIWVATNALLPDVIVGETEKMLGLQKRGGLGVTVSIDGIGKTHDVQRGVEGAYEKSLETLAGLSELRIKNHHMSLSVGMTLTPNNQRDITSVMSVAEANCADFTIRPANISELYYRNEPVAGKWEIGIVRDGLRRIEESYIRRRGMLGAAPVISYLRMIPNYISTSKREVNCTAGSSSFFLDPHGEVYPCLFVGKKMGNITKAPLEASWVSSEAKAARQLIKDGHCPGCWVECEAMRDVRRDKIGLAKAVLRGSLGRFVNRSS